MTLTMKKRASSKEVSEAIEMIKKRKGFNPVKYSGKLKRGLDGLKYQKKLRDEWK